MPTLRRAHSCPPRAARVAALVLCLAAAGCAPAEGEVYLPAAPRERPATADPGLTSGCEGDAPPSDRLRGAVYALPATVRHMPDFGALAPAGEICLDRLEVTERRGAPGFPGVRNRYEWFGVDLRGVFRADEPTDVLWRLSSDDGSRLYIDGRLVIDDDGYHVTRSAEAGTRLAAGPHEIHVPYWQGPGPMTLVLEVARPGEAYHVFRLDVPLEPASP